LKFSDALLEETIDVIIEDKLSANYVLLNMNDHESMLNLKDKSNYPIIHDGTIRKFFMINDETVIGFNCKGKQKDLSDSVPDAETNIQFFARNESEKNYQMTKALKFNLYVRRSIDDAGIYQLPNDTFLIKTWDEEKNDILKIWDAKNPASEPTLLWAAPDKHFRLISFDLLANACLLIHGVDHRNHDYHYHLFYELKNLREFLFTTSNKETLNIKSTTSSNWTPAHFSRQNSPKNIQASVENLQEYKFNH